MLKRFLRAAFVLLLWTSLQSFQWFGGYPHSFNSAADNPYELDVCLQGEDFKSIATTAYSKFDFSSNPLDFEVFVKALRGYLFLKQTNEISNDRFLTVVDYSLSSKRKRLWLLDMRTKRVVLNDLVAHGKNSGGEYATAFSNRINSLQSSLGFYLTGDTYNGKHKYSLKLNGIEVGYNSNAFARGVVIHGADYVDDRIVDAGQRIGRSYGCPAVPQCSNAVLVDLIKGGSCLYIHHTDKRYLQRSKILNSNLYVPIEELHKLVD